MEIGSFIEMQFPKGMEYYSQKEDIVRLNSGRAAIWHALQVLSCRTVWLPYYQCDSVRIFLCKKGVHIKFYHIDKNFTPVDIKQSEQEAVLIVNYFGIMSGQRISRLALQYKNVIIDNSQAFFAQPLPDCMNVYSARKFVGAADGAYVIGRHAERYSEEYPQGYSSDTAAFLFMRIEYGCEGKAYASRMVNERRINHEDAMKMSALTYAILDGTDYGPIKQKRRENFAWIHQRIGDRNLLDPMQYYDSGCIPMVYPFMAADDGLLKRLLAAKHFQGRWWDYLLDEMQPDSVEYRLSRYMVPVTIDQRYGRDEIEAVIRIIRKG